MTTSADNDKIPTAAAASKHDDNPVAPSPVDSEFADIAPYDDRQFHARLERLSREPGFEHAVRFIMPGVDFEDFRRNLLQVRDQHDFQTRIMGGFLMHLEKMTTSGVSADGAENICDGRSYTFMSNHRDIVLDASFLNLCLLRFGKPLTQVAIGNNLLIYEWISDLVKLNRSFIVKRNVRPLEALNAARQLSAYIHFTINKKNESVWIAQREGRTKDSNDMTQESLVKMLGIAGEGNMVDHIAEINLLPVSISYEYDPNDYLKVREYLLKRRNPEYKKCQHDDLLSMETGLTGFKGRVHFHFGRCINEDLSRIPVDIRTQNSAASRQTVTKSVCRIIDRTIHTGYHFYPINYIAFDWLEGSSRFAGHYTDRDVDGFENYVAQQLAKVNVDDVTEDEAVFMRRTLLSMYANPVRNQLAARSSD